MEHVYGSGEVIIREGEAHTSAFWITKGRVEVSKLINGQRLVLAVLDVTSPLFGEMSLIDDKPRSATVTAIEPCVVQEITASTLQQFLSESPPTVQMLVKLLVNRIRGMNEGILSSVSTLQTAITEVRLAGIGRSAASLEPKEFTIQKFPFRIGRRPPTSTAWRWSQPATPEFFSFTQRDLLLDDFEPFNVSPAHCSIVRVHEDIFVLDEGSAKGTIVNGCRVGGANSTREARCDHEKNLIILGSPTSHHQFELTILRAEPGIAMGGRQ